MECSNGTASTSDSSSSGLLIDLSDGCLTRTISFSGSLTATSCSSAEAVEEPSKASEEQQQQASPAVDSQDDWWWLKPLPQPEDKDYKLLRPIDEEEFDFDIPEEFLNTSLSSSESDNEITDDSFDLEAFIRQKRRTVAPSPLIQARTASTQETNKMVDSTASQTDSAPINIAPSLVATEGEAALSEKSVENDSLTSNIQTTEPSCSAVECPIELDQNSEEKPVEIEPSSCDKDVGIEEGRSTSLVEDKNDIVCDEEPVVSKDEERQECKEESTEKSNDSQKIERESKEEVKNSTVEITTTTDTSTTSDSVRSLENSTDSRPRFDSQPQTEEEGDVVTGQEEGKAVLGDSCCSSSSSERDGSRAKLTDSAQSSCSSSTASSPTKPQTIATEKRGLKRPMRSTLAKPAVGKASKTVASSDERAAVTKPSSSIKTLPQLTQNTSTASNFIRTKTFRVKKSTRPNSKQPVLQRPSIPPKSSGNSPPKPARKNTIHSKLSSPAKVSLSNGLAAKKPPFSKAARPVANRPQSQLGNKKTAATATGEKQVLKTATAAVEDAEQAVAQAKTAAITLEDESSTVEDNSLSQSSSPIKKQSTPIKMSAVSLSPSSHSLSQTLDFSLSSIKSESTDKQSNTFTKDTDPPSPPHFPPQEPTVIKKPTLPPTKRRSIPRPATGLLKSSVTATSGSNLPKPSVPGPAKGSGLKSKGSKLPRTNTRAGILRAQKLSTKVEKVNEVALMNKMGTLPKVVHSPADKENKPSSPHSEWSPIRRRKPSSEESYTMCTKHTHQ